MYCKFISTTWLLKLWGIQYLFRGMQSLLSIFLLLTDLFPCLVLSLWCSHWVYSQWAPLLWSMDFFYSFSIFSVTFSLTVTETSYAFTFTDIAVVTTSEIDLFSDTGNLTGKLPKPTAELQSLEFDPVNEVLFVSDDTNSNVSIYTLNLRGDGALEPFIQSKNCITFVCSCRLNLLSAIKICT